MTNKTKTIYFTVALPVYLDNVGLNPRTIDISGVSSLYVVSHNAYGSSLSPNYVSEIDRKLTLTGLSSQQVQIDIIALEMEGYDNGNCEPDDRLEISISDPPIEFICSDTPASHWAYLTNNELSLRFVTNTYTEDIGFWLQITGK